MTAPLKVSLAQQLEEIDYELEKRKKNRPLPIKATEHDFHVTRLQAVRRSLAFIFDNKEAFLKFVEQEKATHMQRDVGG